MTIRPARQHQEPLSPEILRLVEGIALTLAQEHHALEIAGKGLGEDDERREDGRLAESILHAGGIKWA